MQYNENEITLIGEYAGLLMTITDISVLMQLNEDELRAEISDNTTDASRAYRLEKTKTRLEFHRQEIELARLGSPLAVELTRSYIINQISNE